jgi:hypothetical protein
MKRAFRQRASEMGHHRPLTLTAPIGSGRVGGGAKALAGSMVKLPYSHDIRRPLRWPQEAARLKEGHGCLLIPSGCRWSVTPAGSLPRAGRAVGNGMAANPLQKQPNGQGRVQARPASVDSIVRSTPSLARARCHLASKSLSKTRSESAGTESQPLACISASSWPGAQPA